MSICVLPRLLLDSSLLLLSSRACASPHIFHNSALGPYSPRIFITFPVQGPALITITILMLFFARRLHRQREVENASSIRRPPPEPVLIARSKPPPAPKRKRHTPLSSLNSFPAAIPPIRPDHHAAALTKARIRLATALAHGHAPQTSSNYNYAIK